MKMRMLAAACAVCTFLAGGAAAAQFSRSAMEYVQDMGPGINIGNTLDVPKGDEVEWGNAKISHELIKLYKDKGFEVVRVPISWRRQFDRNDPKNIINPAFLARIKQVVDWCLAEDLITIINIHHDGGDDGWPGAWLTIDGKHDDLLMTRAIGLHICFNEMEMPKMISIQARVMRRKVSVSAATII